jgi:hypothetical protein
LKRKVSTIAKESDVVKLKDGLFYLVSLIFGVRSSFVFVILHNIQSQHLTKLLCRKDSNENGTLDKQEVFLGIEQYCEAREIIFDSRVISRLWSEVDDNNDQVLDRHEFSIFSARYCQAIGVTLDDMAFVVLEQLASSDVVTRVSNPNINANEAEGNSRKKLWRKLVKDEKIKKRQSWAELIVESENALGTSKLKLSPMEKAIAMLTVPVKLKTIVSHERKQQSNIELRKPRLKPASSLDRLFTLPSKTTEQNQSFQTLSSYFSNNSE